MLPRLRAHSGPRGHPGNGGRAPCRPPWRRCRTRPCSPSAGAKHGVDPALLAAVAKAESGYDPRGSLRRRCAGAHAAHARDRRVLGVDPLDPAQAVDGSARLLGQLLGRFGGRVDLALAGYNAGAGAVQRYGGVPPYPETRDYVHA